MKEEQKAVAEKWARLTVEQRLEIIRLGIDPYIDEEAASSDELPNSVGIYLYVRDDVK